MKYAFFSDLHIKETDDIQTNLFIKFCQSKEVQESEHIILLGDMFDLLIGEHRGYIKKFSSFFDEIIKLIDSGKKVTYLEGNHDYHVQKTFLKFIKKNSKNHSLFKYRKDGDYIKDHNMNIYYCHGDEVDYYNQYFKRWKRIYTSKWFSIFVSYIMPYFLIEYLGKKASQNSKSRGKRTFDYEKMKDKYRAGAKALATERGVDIIISGHTHIEDDFEFNGKRYINNGFPLKHKKFIFLDTNQQLLKLISLT